MSRRAKSSDHFSEVAEAYASRRPSYPLALIDYLASVALHRGLAWDAGCGSGQLSVLLAERFERAVATDASVEQIQKATGDPRVDYYCARAEASGLSDSVVDLAVAAQAAHWFDSDAYYAEVRRAARPGAGIALVTYGTVTVAEEVDLVIGRFYSETLGPYWPPERRHVEDGYRSLAFPFREHRAPEMEIRMEGTLTDLFGDVVGRTGTGAGVRS